MSTFGSDKDVSKETFDRMIKELPATQVAGLSEAIARPKDDGAVWFETRNFGFILSARNPKTGKRRILARC